MLIAIEGAIGVGKSLLQQRLLENYVAEPIIEEYDRHPLLDAFYRDPQEYWLAKDVIFLFMSYHKLRSLRDRIDDQLFISDFTFDKALVFASVFHGETEAMTVFRSCYDYLSESALRPAIIIHLVAPIATIQTRIMTRARPMEMAIPADYLESLVSSYEAMLGKYRDGIVIEIDTENHDFVNKPGDLPSVMSTLEQARPDLAGFRRGAITSERSANDVGKEYCR